MRSPSRPAAAGGDNLHQRSFPSFSTCVKLSVPTVTAAQNFTVSAMGGVVFNVS